MVVVKFLAFVSEVVSTFSKILIWIIGGGQKDTFAPPTQLLGGACPGCPPKSTPMIIMLVLYLFPVTQSIIFLPASIYLILTVSCHVPLLSRFRSRCIIFLST